jgi:hypothetical protein
MQVITSYAQIFTNADPQLMTSLLGAGDIISAGYNMSNATMHNITYMTNRYIKFDNSDGADLNIDELGSPKYTLINRVPVHIKDNGDEYILSFKEAEISRSGASAKEALDWLKSSLVKLYELYKSAPALGPLPARQLRVLEKYIVEKSHSKT